MPSQLSAWPLTSFSSAHLSRYPSRFPWPRYLNSNQHQPPPSCLSLFLSSSLLNFLQNIITVWYITFFKNLLSIYLSPLDWRLCTGRGFCLFAATSLVPRTVPVNGSRQSSGTDDGITIIKSQPRQVLWVQKCLHRLHALHTGVWAFVGGLLQQPLTRLYCGNGKVSRESNYPLRVWHWETGLTLSICK